MLLKVKDIGRHCLLGSGFTLIFHCCAQWLILAKSLLSSAAELSLLCTRESKEVSSANNLVLDDNSSAKSFMYIKKSSGPSIEPSGTPALTLVHVRLKLLSFSVLSILSLLKFWSNNLE